MSFARSQKWPKTKAKETAAGVSFKVSDGRKSVKGIARFQRGEKGINEEKTTNIVTAPDEFASPSPYSPQALD